MMAYWETVRCSGAECQIFTLSARGFDLATYQLLAQRSYWPKATCRPIRS